MESKTSSCLPRSIHFIMIYMFLQAYSYYGLSCILAVYFRYDLGFSQPTSEAFVHWFICATFVFSMLGGVLADKWVGKFKMIVLAGGLWMIGGGMQIWATWPGYSAALAVPLVGLVLAGIGKGLGTPVNSALLGDEASHLPKDVVSDMFARFYFFICAGSFATKFATPWVRSHLDNGNFIMFCILEGVLVLALLFFATGGLGKVQPPPVSGASNIGFAEIMRVVITAIRLKFSRCCVSCMPSAESRPLRGEVPSGLLEGPAPDENDPSWLDTARGYVSEPALQAAKAILGVLSTLVPIPIFWALFFQTYSTWVFQAEHMNRLVSGYIIPQDMTQLLGPLLDVLLILLFNKVIYPLFVRCGRPLRPLQRMGIGIFMSVASFVLSGGIQLWVDANPVINPDTDPVGGISVFWQIPQYFLISVGEIMIAITGLEFAYSQTPRTLKSVMSAIWYLCVGLGNVLVAVFALLSAWSPSTKMFFYAALLFAAGVLFIFIAVGYNYRDKLFCSGGAEEACSTQATAAIAASAVTQSGSINVPVSAGAADVAGGKHDYVFNSSSVYGSAQENEYLTPEKRFWST